MGFGGRDQATYWAFTLVRWKTSGGYTFKILMAERLTSPPHDTSAIRAELQGLIILLRLTQKTLEEAPLVFERVVVTVDNVCIVAALQKGGRITDPSLASRVSEVNQLITAIAAKAAMEKPQRIPDNSNPANSRARATTACRYRAY